MIICTTSRNTSQGAAHCHQPASHNGRGSDHIAYIEDPDQQLWIATWSDRQPGAVDLRTIPESRQP